MPNNLAVKEEAAMQTVTPMSLLQAAQQSNASVEQLQQLMELQIRWEENEARKAFNDAMANFREECPTIARTRKGHNSNYAGLAETITQIKPLLAKHGLSHRWSTNQMEGGISVTCTITHRLGHCESTELSADADKSGNKNVIQAIGSTVAYLERYTLFAILGLASADQDNDGCDFGRDPSRYITESQLADIEALIDEVKADENQFCSWIGAKFLADIPASRFDKAVKALESKRGKS